MATLVLRLAPVLYGLLLWGVCTIPTYAAWRMDQPHAWSTYLHELPSGQSPITLLEQTALPVVVQIEDAYGFAAVDPWKYSVYGDSWTWNSHHWNGHNIDHPLHAGTPAILPPFRSLGSMKLQHAEDASWNGGTGLSFESAYGRKGFFTSQMGFSQAGGRIRLAEPIMDAISGNHAAQRFYLPASRRRSLGPSGLMGVGSGTSTQGWQIDQAVEMRAGVRRFVNFDDVYGNYQGRPDRAYDAVSNLTVRHWVGMRGPGGNRVDMAAEGGEKEGLGREIDIGRNESMDQSFVSALVGWAGKSASARILYHRSLLRVRQQGAAYELHSPNGQALWPWQPAGVVQAVSLAGHGALGPLYARAEGRWIGVQPRTRAWTVPLQYEGQAVGHLDLAAVPEAWYAGSLRSGWADHGFVGRSVAWAADVYGFVAPFVAGDLDHSAWLPDFGGAANLRWHARQRLEVFVLASRRPVAPGFETLRWLAPGYLDGAWFWDERGSAAAQTWGGQWIDIAHDLRPAAVNSFATGLQVQLRPNWYFVGQAAAKLFQNTWRLVLDGDPAQYGYYRGSVYYYGDGPTRYRLTNDARDPSWYYGGYLSVTGETQGQFRFEVGFSAFNVLGRGAFGNGPASNDMGVISYIDASPNAERYAFGNLDQDRGFALKSSTAVRVVRDLWGYITLSFRDGTPFTQILYQQDLGQVAMLHDTYRGSPLQGRPLLGPREDFQINFDLRLAYEFRLPAWRGSAAFVVANAFDFGNEIGEVQNLEAGRAALELEIPRTFGFELDFEL